MVDSPNAHVPHYPTYRVARAFLEALNGRSKRLFFSMRDTIRANRGTPQDVRDWSSPDDWIPEVLAGDEADLAFHIWRHSKGVVNPRHFVGVWLLCSSYDLFEMDNDEILYISDSGMDFLENPLGKTVQTIDYGEGLLQLLATVSEHGPGKRSDLLEPYKLFLNEFSQVRSQSSQANYWYLRINNLLARELIRREGVLYQITEHGLDYLDHVEPLIASIEKDTVEESLSGIRKLVKAQADEVRQKIADTLSEINPYLFEFLIKRLLEAMGYNSVEVTSRSGDGGVDVIAEIEVGITLVREVVQVKRRSGSLGRTVLDQLRGSLHRFDATRGTVITNGRFTKGALEAAFERGAAPITLIDGDRLIGLLIENTIGAEKSPIDVLKFRPTDFELEEE